MYYVYLLKDPTTDTAFYCGKGSKDRWKSHFGYWSNNGKNNPCENKIRALRKNNIEPVVEFLHTNIEDEDEAYRLEEEYIKNNFVNKTISPLKLFLFAIPPTFVAVLFFKFF